MARKAHIMPTLDALVQSHACFPPLIAEQPPSDVEVSTDISSNSSREPVMGADRQTG
jgi:hypothetical protein